MSSSTVSNDFLWQVVRSNSSFLVKRRAAGGLQFSKDPLNVLGLYNPSASGFLNNKAVGVSSGPNGEIQLLTKNKKGSISTTSFKPKTSSRKVAGAVSKAVSGYRDDLVKPAVVKASALSRANLKTKKVYAAKKR